jgi:hypothetical protein
MGRCSAGDEAAFADVYDALAPRLSGYPFSAPREGRDLLKALASLRIGPREDLAYSNADQLLGL